MELRPPILSRRFLTALLAAFEAAPRRAFVALGQLAQGRKLRAWNMLCAAATESPNYYTRWISGAEPAAIERWYGSPVVTASLPRIGVLVLGVGAGLPADEPNTMDSIRQAFPDTVKVQLIEASSTFAELAEQLGSGAACDWLLPVWAGDILSPDLARVVAEAAQRCPRAELHFWDEDCLSDGRRCDPWIKPDWDDLLFSAYGGLSSAAIVKSGLFNMHLAGIPGSEPVTVAAVEQVLQQIAKVGNAHHIPLILTHRAGQRQPANAVRPTDPLIWPSVSIIIPVRDKPELLRTCLEGISRLEYHGEIERLILDNGSTDPEALRLLGQVGTLPGHRVVSMPGPFNFSRLNNAGAKLAGGALLCLLNNDVEPLDGTWLTVMVRHAVQESAGAVGALLLYPDRTVQHAGVSVGVGGAAGHIQRGVTLEEPSHRQWAFATRQVSAVTAACLVVDRAKFWAVGGLDEANLAVAFNDVDFCLKLDAKGWRNIYAAEACLIHHESKSRGQDDVPEKAERFQKELLFLQTKWQTLQYSDPRYSPLFLRSSERCVLAY